MSSDLGAELRERLRGVTLPAAPHGLDERVRAVTSEAVPRARQRWLGRRGRVLAPLAAVLVIAAVAVSGGGGQPPSFQPPSASVGSPGPSTGPMGPGVAALSVQATVGEWCSPGGCEFHVELEGPGGPWSGQLDQAELGDPTGITPSLPEELPVASYSLRAEIHVIGDAVYPGETGPRDLGISATCAADFQVTPETQTVDVTLSFWLDRCSAGAVATAEPE